MGEVHALETLLQERTVWRGRAPVEAPREGTPTGLAQLDAALPAGGWIVGGLAELLIPSDGVGELELLWPLLSRHAAEGRTVVLISPPYRPYPPAWHCAGVGLGAVQVVNVEAREALWAAEQCMRSGACAVVVCWPKASDDRALRRLHIAAEAGHCHAIAIRPLQAARNPSPAALRIAIEPGMPRQVRVLKCRGANPPVRPIPFPTALTD